MVHVVLVPLSIAGLILYHVYLVIAHGVTSPIERRVPIVSKEQHKRLYVRASDSEEKGEDFYPETTAASGLYANVVVLLAVTLALIMGPATLMPEANLTESSFPIEEWWFWWYSALIALLPASIAPSFYVLFPLSILTILIDLPFIDRGPYRGVRNRPFFSLAVVASLIGILYLSDLRRRSPWTAFPSDELTSLPAGVNITEELEVGRRLFTQFGCNSCHAVAGSGRLFGPDLAHIHEPMSVQELIRFIASPPDGVAMPPYESRMSAGELRQVAEFVLVAQTWVREP